MRAATWHGESRFTLDDLPEPAPGPGPGARRRPHGGHLRQRRPRHPGPVPADAAPRDGARVQRHGAGGRPRREPGPRGARGRLRAELRVRRLRRTAGRAASASAREAVRVGGFAERVVLPRHCVHALPEGLDLATAALAEPAACCLEGLEMARMRRGATVVVIGGGIMGLLTLALAKARGAGTAILSDPVASRREAAATARRRPHGRSDRRGPRRGGAHAPRAAAASTSPARRSGSPSSLAAAARLVRPRGVVQLVGVCPKGSTLPVDLFDFHFRRADPHRRLRPRDVLPPRAAAPHPDRRREPGDRPVSARAHRRGVRPRGGRAGSQDRHHARRRLARAEADHETTCRAARRRPLARRRLRRHARGPVRPHRRRAAVHAGRSSPAGRRELQGHLGAPAKGRLRAGRLPDRRAGEGGGRDGAGSPDAGRPLHDRSSRRRTSPGRRSSSSWPGGRAGPSRRAGARFADAQHARVRVPGQPTPRPSTPKEAIPKQTLSPVKTPPDDYDASFRIEQVQTRFETVMKSWEGARRRVGPGALGEDARDGELAGFSTGLGELARVKSGRKAEVVPVATQPHGTRADRVGALVRDHTGELPPQLVEEWIARRRLAENRSMN